MRKVTGLALDKRLNLCVWENSRRNYCRKKEIFVGCVRNAVEINKMSQSNPASGWEGDRKPMYQREHPTAWPVSRKSPELFRPKIQLSNLFWKADLLTCFYCKKNQEDCEVWWLRNSAFRRYKRDRGTQNRLEKFGNFWETGDRFSKVPKAFQAWKAIRRTPTRKFWKAGLFIWCKGNKN